MPRGNAIPCTSCLFDADTSTPQCDPAPDPTDCTNNPSYVQCVKNGSFWSGIYVIAAYDGNPLFFPADAIAKPWSPDTTAQISGNYDASWSLDPVTGRTHNFSFTTEVRFWFRYDSSKSYKLTFAGDDDFWVFINKQLAVDIGGIHTAVVGALSIDSGTILPESRHFYFALTPRYTRSQMTDILTDQPHPVTPCLSALRVRLRDGQANSMRAVDSSLAYFV